MGQQDTEILLQQLPTGWSLYNGGNRLHNFGGEGSAAAQAWLDEAALLAGVAGGGYWRQTRWRDTPTGRTCTQYRWVAM